jgi:tetratricopeptide (TPR) repeat protein
LLAFLRRLDDAAACLDDAQREAGRLPDSPARQELLARIFLTRGLIHAHAGRFPEAEKNLAAADDWFRRLTPARRGLRDNQRRLGKLHYSRGLLLSQGRQVVEGEKHFLQALGIQEKLAAAPDAPLVVRQELLQTKVNYGQVLWMLNRTKAAEQQLRPAVKIAQQLVEKANNPAFHHDYSVAAYNLASFEYAQAKFADSHRLLRLSIRHGELADEQGHNDPRRPALKLEQYVALTRVALRLGNHAEAFAALEEGAPLAPKSAPEFFHMACFAASCIPLAEKDKGLSPPERDKVIGTYRERALEHLRAAVQAGYRDAQALQRQPELAPLRGTEGFKALLETIAKK